MVWKLLFVRNVYLVVVILSVYDNQSSPFVCLCDHCIVYFDIKMMHCPISIRFTKQSIYYSASSLYMFQVSSGQVNLATLEGGSCTKM